MRNSLALSLLIGTTLATINAPAFANPAVDAVEAATIANSPAAVVVPVAAKRALMPGCNMREQVSLNVQYNFKANSFAEAKKMFDEQNAKVEALAKKQALAKFELQNQNYNIYSQPQNYGQDGQPQSYTYQVSGTSTYVMESSDAAFKFAELLTAQKIQVGMNSNMYRQGNCNN